MMQQFTVWPVGYRLGHLRVTDTSHYDTFYGFTKFVCWLD